MKLIEKILVATDFSAAAHDAWRAALAVAAKFRSRLLLVHVIPGAVDVPLELENVHCAHPRQVRRVGCGSDRRRFARREKHYRARVAV